MTRDFDWTLLVVVLLLAAMGALMVHSATAGRGPTAEDLGGDQLVRVVIGLLVLALCTWPRIRFWRVVAFPSYTLTLVLLALVLAIGETRGGATRWIALGPLLLQPSELAKATTPLALAAFLADRRESPLWRTLALAATIVAIPFGFILLQPDLGTGIVLLPVALVMLWWSEIPFLTLFSLAVPLISIVCAFSLWTWSGLMLVVVVVLKRARAGFWRFSLVLAGCITTGLLTPSVWNMLEDYQKTRLLIFLNPGLDPRGSGWNIIQSRIAIGSGQIFGKGYMAGTQKGLAFLPAQHTDFIFSVTGEELGWLGAELVLVLFVVFLWRSISIAAKCRSTFARTLAAGLATTIGVQFAVNVSMTLGLLPVTGLPLPFVSYGGSHVIVSLGMVGVLQSLRMSWKEM
jgi:rod shape determining protein RodA